MKYLNYNKKENVVSYATEVCTYYKDPTDYDLMDYDFEMSWSKFWNIVCDSNVWDDFDEDEWAEEPKTIEEKIAFIEELESKKSCEDFLESLDEKAQRDWEDRRYDNYPDYEEREEPNWDYLERTIWWDNEK